MNKWLSSAVKAYTDVYGKTSAPVIYEVGSRDGNDGVELAERIYSGENLKDDATIVLFECLPPHIEQIEQNYPWATLITEAISDKAGEAYFLQIHGNPDYMGSSSLDLSRKEYNWVNETETIKVKTRRLDDVIKELGHTEIDIMKIDIEGYTMEALRSLGKYLKNVKVFHLETEIEGVARKDTNLDVALFMQNNGYTCLALENEWGDNIQDQTWRRNA